MGPNSMSHSALQAFLLQSWDWHRGYFGWSFLPLRQRQSSCFIGLGLTQAIAASWHGTLLRSSLVTNGLIRAPYGYPHSSQIAGSIGISTMPQPRYSSTFILT